ncbi:MAG: OmpH family outer membrane protein [Deltaproteobacteria bacterium]|nr:OmpH family outer membrane protein [Deltaproteobacteria bacterium]
MRIKVILAMTCCVAFGLTLCAVSHAADKVGFINLQRLVNESTMGKAARAEIQKMRKQREEIVSNKLWEVNNLKSLLTEKGAAMDPVEKRSKIEKLRSAYKEYQRLLADAKEDILREDRELVAIILQKANGVLKQVAKKRKYTIILKDPKAIGYLDPSVDITDEVLKGLNKK